ncbi:MAG: exodeoxyribonuclease V subunit gamma [Acidimicrobiales bacterium]
MLHLHRSERADGLVTMLADLLAEPLGDAMSAEVVAVPTRGVERWLTQQLSARLGVTPGRQDGVCANLEFPFPGSVIGAALALGGGVDPHADPWAPERSVWPLLEVVDASLGERWLAPLAAHLENSAPSGEIRRFASVRHISDLYDRYGVHRPGMVRSWLDGGADRPSDGWQPELWRRLRRRVGTPSPAERLIEACARLQDEPALLELPARLSLFGLTRLPASYLDVLDAIAAARDVHLFLLHPSPALWRKVASRIESPTRGLPRAEDPTTDESDNPLLTSWGRDAREMQLVLRGSASTSVTDHHVAIEDDADDLLHRLQADVRADRRPRGLPTPGSEDQRPLLDPADRSIQVHACHGRARQVEVVRDSILHLLEEDETLEPRDVIVMCPDIDTFAPLIQATFGSYDPDDTDTHSLPDLRVRLADRSLRQTNPVLGVLAELLDLAGGRLTATQVLDLASREPVRRRFHLDDDDLTRIEEWVAGTGVRWGLDAPHRAPFRLEELAANTWRAGLDRALLGVAMAEEGQRLFGGVLPLDDMDSGDIELAGKLAELLDRLGAAVSLLSGTRPLDAWAAGIAEIADAFTATSEQDTWQRLQLQRLLDDLVGEATTGDTVSGVELSPADVGALLADRLRGRPTRANFRTGHLTICTLVPMRSVPHRVVCLLGLDDGVFPRHIERDGDDLIAANPQVGDNDARTEDRQLLLDALLAAADRLVITYTARDERSNLARPPAVPLGELLDVIDRTVRTDGGAFARQQLTIHHPLQPFDVRNFTNGALIADRPWSFDTVNLDGARAATRPRSTPGPWLPAPLPEVELQSVELERLEAFLRHPVRAFLRHRLGISLTDRARDVGDALPIDLDGLERWGVAERILTARLAGAELDDCIAAERARGLLPPGELATPVLDMITPAIEQLVAVGRSDVEPTSLDINIELPDATGLIGTVADLQGDVLHTVTYSSLSPSHRLIAWGRLLALSAAWPERAFEAVTIGRAREGARGATVTAASIRALGGDPATRQQVALRFLGTLLDLYRRGLCEPLPLYLKTSAAWTAAARDRKDAAKAASKAWTSDFNYPRENRDREHVLVLGGEVSFDSMLAGSGQPGPGEEGDGWAASEATRFGRYARRLWDDLLDHEELVDR